MPTSPELQAIRLADYTVPAFSIESIDLVVELGPHETTVRSTMMVRRNPDARESGDALELDGRNLELIALEVESVEHGRYSVGDRGLRIEGVPDGPEPFEVRTTVRIDPAANDSLEGLYYKSDIYCTQCEAEGFRKITYYLDRPDVMSVFTTTVIADPKHCPILLSNGNPTKRGELPDGRHSVTWHDPYRKPSYLFALVAGDLAALDDEFTTKSGRRVDLHIYTEHKNLAKCDWAMRCLKEAMRWDEEKFGLECDLDAYSVVVTDDFNMGAMENKGLNIFNSQYVLAQPETATDDDYRAIEAVVAHEYLHNWTGNRVTCRDWFQLSLKEGLTVFRDQLFSADMGSAAVKRIEDVRTLRGRQFPEDRGPMAHPVRPESVIEINNFYTATVYEKGAEVVRMYHTLFGEAGFRRGLSAYLERFDGQAVTCADFRRAMSEANGRDLEQFDRWYSQAGTPTLTVVGSYDASACTYSLRVSQAQPETPDQVEKHPLHIPFAIGLLAPDGSDMALESGLVELTEREQTFEFGGVPHEPVVSLLRGFSAPVKIEFDYSEEQLSFLIAHDSDLFNRWEASQRLARGVLLRLVQDARDGRVPSVPDVWVDAARALLTDSTLDRELVAETLTLPSETELAEAMDVVDVVGIHRARTFLRRGLVERLRAEFMSGYRTGLCAAEGGTSAWPGREDIARRRLANTCLGYLAMVPDDEEVHALCANQFECADNMTDRLAAFRCIVHGEGPDREAIVDAFYRRYAGDSLVLDKWFRTQATAPRVDTLSRVQELLAHEAFSIKKPNKVRALIGAFAGTPSQFHCTDGAGYAFIGDQVLALDPINPQVAARLVGQFNLWKRYDAARQSKMREQLERIVGTKGVSRDVYEIASKALR